MLVSRFTQSLKVIDALLDHNLIDLPPDDRDFLVTDRPWPASDRTRARMLIDSVSYTGTDYIGIPRFELPAEFVVAVICSFVGPSNWMTACSCYAGVQDAQSHIDGSRQSFNTSRLFAMCLDYEANGMKAADDRAKALSKKAGARAAAE